MRDPHVQRLYFNIGAEEGTSYRNPACLSFSNVLGNFETEDNKLIVEPSDHFSSEEEARAVIEPFLRSWEIEADLIGDIGTIRFRFDRVEVIDREPQPEGGSRTIELKAGVMAIVGMAATLTVTRSAYPGPPQVFRTSPEVQAAYQRWRNVRAGREPLQSMAYFLLTLIQSRAGGRKEAAAAFGIDPDVLDTVGRLTSTTGDLETARKVSHGSPLRELTGTERNWCEAAVKLMIRRMGEHGSGSPVIQIRMRDLPAI